MVQARRDRDYHREALHTFERKVSEEKHRGESDIKRHKELERRSTDMVYFELFTFGSVQNFVNLRNFKF